MAKDIHELAERLHLEHVYVAGHGIGGMVAYAFARLYPETSRGVMMLDAPLPGLGPWEEIKTNPVAWHINFHQVPELPERLLAGRQRIYSRYFLAPNTFSDPDVGHYVESYAGPEHLRALLEIYRAFPADEKFDAAQGTAINVPLVVATGGYAALRWESCREILSLLKGNGISSTSRINFPAHAATYCRKLEGTCFSLHSHFLG